MDIEWKRLPPQLRLRNYVINKIGVIKHNKKGTFLKGTVSKGRRLFQFYNDEDERVNYNLNYLLAICFLPIYDTDKYYVGHINGDTSDYNISNLEWISRKEFYNRTSRWVEFYENYYVSNFGRIKNGKTEIIPFMEEGKLFILPGNEKMAVDEIVCEVFHNEQRGSFVHHRDGNLLNNNSNNLEWR